MNDKTERPYKEPVEMFRETKYRLLNPKAVNIMLVDLNTKSFTLIDLYVFKHSIF